MNVAPITVIDSENSRRELAVADEVITRTCARATRRIHPYAQERTHTAVHL